MVDDQVIVNDDYRLWLTLCFYMRIMAVAMCYFCDISLSAEFVI